MIELLNELEEKNVSLFLDQEELKLSYKGDAIEATLLDKIRNNKIEIITFLKKYSKTQSYEEIPLTDERECYPLSSSQYRIWLSCSSEEISITYNVSNYLTLNEEYDVKLLIKAIEATVDRHETLRTVFRLDDEDNIKQWIVSREKSGFQVNYYDYRGNIEKEKLMRSYIEEDSIKYFSLDEGPLLRVSIFQTERDCFVLCFNIHHIISDTWSLEVLNKDILEFYTAYKKNTKPNLPILLIQYKDYSVWHEKQEDKKIIEQELYWLEKLSGELAVLDLPSYVSRPPIRTYNGISLETYLSKDITRRLKLYCEENGLSLFMGLLSLWSVLFYKYTGSKDIIIGTAVSGRDHLDLKHLVGCFINTIVLRNEINPEDDFISFCQKVKEEALMAFNHQAYPFNRLISKLQPERDYSRGILFDVMFLLQNSIENSENDFLLEDSKIDSIKLNGKKGTITDLDISFKEEGKYLKLDVSFNTDIYNKSMVEGLIKHFKLLLSNLLNNPKEKINKIDYLGESEKNQLLVEFNNTKVDYPKDKTIIDLFEEQVKKTPNNTAVVFESKELTYKELNEQANELGFYLRNKYDIHPDDLVGIKLDRSERMIIAILGVLKSGGAYVPIDPSYPQDRIEYIEKDSQSKVIIDEEEFKLFYKEQGQNTKLNIEKINQSHDLAYVIYTSGTMGNPKGVMVEHGNVIRLVKPCTFFPLNQENILLSTGSVSFDATIIEFFGTLLNGSKLILTNQNNLLELDRLENIIKFHKVNSLWMTASWFNNVVENNIRFFENINQLIVGGDVVSPNHTLKVFESYPTINIINGYGPTENTTFSTTFKIKNEKYTTIPIGRPISNTQIYILDKGLQPVPLGVIGKIYVSGAGVARGYLNNPELTAEKFITNPYIEGVSMYDTGDLGCWLADGNIEFIGRKDHQVKIRGFRIELGEIENIILQYSEGLRQVVVESKEINSEKSLVAYFTSSVNIDKLELRRFIHEKLPEYMVPSFYMELEKLPLTSNGKIDRKALPNVDGEDLLREEYVSPRNEIERKLVEIWQEVLKHENIGIKDNFYNLGGDSIKIIKVISLLKENGFSLKVVQILQNPFIEDLAKLVESFSVVTDQSEVMGPVPLTPIQCYFFESEIILNKNHYNQSVILKSKTAIDSIILDKSISSLVLHHDTLRMIYKFEDNSWLQYNEDTSRTHYKIKFYDLREESNGLESLHRLGEELQSSFDISSGVLFHIGHFRMSDGDYLALIIHHLVVDGISWRILFEDLSNLYESYKIDNPISLPSKTDSFQRWALHQKEYAMSEKIQTERLYWEEVSREVIPLLPEDCGHREKVLIMDSSNQLTLDASFTKKLQTQVHHVFNTEINDILLTGLGLAIRDVFGIQKSVVKMEGHGREEIIEGLDVGRTIGWFTSIYPFVLDVSNSEGRELVSVKEALRKIPNKGVGYGILKYLDKGFSNELIPSIQFNYLGDFGENIGGNKEEPLFEFSSGSIGSNVENGQSEVLLDVSGMMVMNQLSLAIRYSSNSFNKETIDKLVVSYENHLQNLINKLTRYPLDNTHLNKSAIKYDFGDYNNEQWKHNNLIELSPNQNRFIKLKDSLVVIPFEISSFNENKFEAEFRLFLSEFPVLTLKYEEHKGYLFQRYISADDMQFKILSKDISLLKPEEIDRTAKEFLLREFNLLEGELIRILILQNSKNSKVVSIVLGIHHSLIDDYTAKILKKELTNFFQSKIVKSNYPHPFNFIIYQKKFLASKYGFEERNYWIQALKNIPLFNNKIEISDEKPDFVIQERVISDNSFKSIRKLAANNNLPISAFFNAFFQMILNTIKIDNKKVYGILVNSREQEIKNLEVSKILGVIDNMLPLTYGDSYFDIEGIRKCYSKYLEARLYQRIPYETIREDMLKVSKKDLDDNIIGYFNFLVKESSLSIINPINKTKKYTENVPDFKGVNMKCVLYRDAVEVKLVCLKEIYDLKTDIISLDNYIEEYMKLINSSI